MRNVLLDTNVVVSGLLYRGKPFEILKLAEVAKIRLSTTIELFNEFEQVIRRKRFEPRINTLGVSPELLILKYFLLTKLVRLDPRIELLSHEQPRDNSDEIVLRSALSVMADVIVTGDEDLLSMNTIRTISIISPQKYLSELKAIER